MNHRGEQLDARAADRVRRYARFALRADHPQRVFVGTESKPVADVGAAHMTSGCRLGTESHSSTRDVKYQPPRS